MRPAAIEKKSNFVTSRKQLHVPSDLFRHIEAYSGISQANSEPCVTVAYSEPLYIQNPGTFKTRRIFQNPGISKTLAHSEPETYSES